MMESRFVVYFIFAINLLIKEELQANAFEINDTNYSKVVHHSETFKVIDWKFDELKNYLIYCTFIIVVILMKIGYHHVPRLSKYVPESCLLLFVGIVFGVIIKFLLKRDNVKYFKLTPELFFYILLPPIILESYSLYHRNFLDNLLAILVFAVIGTLLNFLIIGFVLYGFSQIGLMKKLELTLLHCLLFGALIVAVDPVAVLAIFNEVGVNEDLYYLVFGESLLNDAVCVVLYEMMQEFALMKEIGAKNIILGFVSFFTVSLGGMIIGIIFGILSCLIIRVMANRHTVFLEPILLIAMGYISYLVGDLVGWSGIISMISCGLIQAAYALPAISEKSNLILKRFVKILASICEPIIFLFLGVEIVIGRHSWEVSFIMCALLLCMAARFIVTFSLSGVINFIHMNMRNIPMQEKFIISYGGLRGAVAFSLAVLINDKIFDGSAVTKDMIISTTLIIILFTIVVQGMTVKPLVKCLQITKTNKENKISLFYELNQSVINTSTKAIENIMGDSRRSQILTVMQRFSEKHIRPFLQGKSIRNHGKFIEINSKINEILLALQTDPSKNQLHRLPNSYKNLLAAKENPQLKINDSEVRKRPSLIHTMSDITGHQSSKPVKRLSKYLYRTATFNIDEDNSPWNASLMMMNTFTTVPSVIKAKDKFLGGIQKRKTSTIEEESSLLNKSLNGDDKLVFKDASNANTDDEKSSFY